MPTHPPANPLPRRACLSCADGPYGLSQRRPTPEPVVGHRDALTPDQRDLTELKATNRANEKDIRRKILDLKDGTIASIQLKRIGNFILHNCSNFGLRISTARNIRSK